MIKVELCIVELGTEIDVQNDVVVELRKGMVKPNDLLPIVIATLAITRRDPVEVELVVTYLSELYMVKLCIVVVNGQIVVVGVLVVVNGLVVNFRIVELQVVVDAHPPDVVFAIELLMLVLLVVLSGVTVSVITLVPEKWTNFFC